MYNVELKAGHCYRAKVIDDEEKDLFNKKVKVKYTGIYLRGKKQNSILFLSQVELLEEITEEEFGNN